ncbi:polyprenyl synthetase family protein [Acidobacteriota bacterium]
MKEMVDSALSEFLSGGRSLLYESMAHSVLSGGKRFRPLLMISTGDYFNVPREEILPFACGIELIHNYSLVHDDLPCMDDDDIRRGQPTCHKAYGEDIALLTGDALLTLAFEVMAGAPENRNHPLRKIHAIHEISRGAGVDGMIGGQLLDIKYSPKEFSDQKMDELILKKTGGLILASVSVGGILGGISAEKMSSLKQFGRNLGLAFQIRDDVLDFDHDQPDGSSPRPNLAHRIGLDGAKARLKQHIEKAEEALSAVSINSERLRFLAERLLILKEEN